ncbi:MAG: hypothetical protein IPJ86_05610 [Bacteroidetes bacterium]|nr:hypothetical protein [Bacteroidota bacterium]
MRDLHGNPKLFNDMILDSDCDEEPNPDNKYFIIEPLLNFLVADGMLRRKNQDIEGEECLCLTDKGYSTMKDLKNLGYVIKEKENNKETAWKVVLRYVAIATLIFVLTRFFLDFILPQFQSKQTQTASPTTQTPKRSHSIRHYRHDFFKEN